MGRHQTGESVCRCAVTSMLDSGRSTFNVRPYAVSRFAVCRYPKSVPCSAPPRLRGIQPSTNNQQPKTSNQKPTSPSILAHQLPFQSTLPCGERHWTLIRWIATTIFQSTLPCGERPDATSPIVTFTLISIHAPVRGATLGSTGVTVSIDISIHAPVRGATNHAGIRAR